VNVRKAFVSCPAHVHVGIQFGYDLDEVFREKNEEKKKKQPSPEKPFGSLIGGCQMPLSRSKSCQDCIHHDLKLNCPLHMKQCNAPAWIACNSEKCLRFLCEKHTECYCETRTVGRR